MDSPMDLTGKLIIKVQLGDDIRRIPIHNEAITYDELVLMMQRVFRGKLTSTDDITIKYKDEDGDLITIFDSSDLSFAIQYSRVLKLQLLLAKSNQQTNIINQIELNNIKGQLRIIRDHVNKLLDSLDYKKEEVSNKEAETKSDKNTNNSMIVNQVNSREFDPLQEQNKSKEQTAQVSSKSDTNPPDGQTSSNSSQSVRSDTPTSQVQPNVGQNTLPQSTQSNSYYYGNSGFPPLPQFGNPPVHQQSLPFSDSYNPSSFVNHPQTTTNSGISETGSYKPYPSIQMPPVSSVNNYPQAVYGNMPTLPPANYPAATQQPHAPVTYASMPPSSSTNYNPSPIQQPQQPQAGCAPPPTFPPTATVAGANPYAKGPGVQYGHRSPQHMYQGQ